MRNLLSANFFRLRRNPLFLVCTGAMLLFSGVMMAVWCMEGAARSDTSDVYLMDVLYFRLATMVSLAYAVFTCLYLNTEYGEGTVRNKLAVGHTRRNVYLSHFVTIFAASVGIALAWLVGGCVGIPYAGFLELPPAGLALCGVIIVGFIASFSAIFTLIGMLNTRRTAIVISLLVWLAFMLMAGMTDSALYEPEFISNAAITVDGVLMEHLEPNLFYISGIQRAIYEFILDLLPMGQMVKLQNIRLDNPVRMLLCDLGVTAAATLGGIALFERKDLK